MKIYDISQEIYSCEVFPGDPVPEKTVLSDISKGDACNLTAFSMCAHNGTHIDAPFHFYMGGKTVDEISLEKFIGDACVVTHNGDITAEDARYIIRVAKSLCCDKRILIKGSAVVTSEAAEVFSNSNLYLIGNESQTFGTVDAPMDVHLKFLTNEIVLLEGIRLTDVPDGKYFIFAAPINLGGADGAPCRAVLIDFVG